MASTDFARTEPNAAAEKVLGATVAAVVTALQAQYLATGRQADAVARLARLRHALASPPGDRPDVWADTVGALPDDLCRGRSADEKPTTFEAAAHDAVTLYALHQAARNTAVHVRGVSVGSAARSLVRATGREEAIRRKFQAIATASTHAGVRHHLRALVNLMRSEGVPLDYAQLAIDLRRLYAGQSASQVRLRWGRDFHRLTAASSNPSDIDPSDATPDTAQEE